MQKWNIRLKWVNIKEALKRVYSNNQIKNEVKSSDFFNALLQYPEACCAEAYSELCETSKMERFAKIVNG